MYFNSSMKIISRFDITVKDLIEGYRQESDLAPNEPLCAYGGKLCIRPAFQRSFVYNKKQASAVIESILKGYPLNNMYWIENAPAENVEENGCMDGQQRTISICEFGNGLTSATIEDFNNGDRFYISDLKYKYPELYERFMNYPLEIKVCTHATRNELISWFVAINTNGEKLTDQELRNANFTGHWLTDAKKYFSKSMARAAATPAESVGSKYLPKSIKPERQELLELAIAWKINSFKEADIWNYMQAHYKDDNANELKENFEAIIKWIPEIFPELPDDYTHQKFWGEMYSAYGQKTYDPDEMSDILKMLINNKEELPKTSIKDIITYCFTRDNRLLTPRAFSPNQKIAMYNRQNGHCARCGESFKIEELDADHIIPWNEGGRTDTSNGQLLCRSCHIKKHNTSIRYNNY